MRLSALLTGAYITFATSAAFAADDYAHGETAHKLEENIDHAEHASKGGLPQFEPDWFASQVFWLAICFAVLYFIFAKKTLPDISGVIENRKNHIQSDLETAEKLTAKADAVHDDYQAGLTKAQDKASQAVQDVENEMKAKAADAQEAFRVRSEDEVKAAEARVVAAKNAAMGDMNDIAADAASKAVEKIIGKTDAGKVKSIVESMNGKAKAA